MILDVSANTANVLLGLRNGQKRLVYGVATALNETAKRIQAAEKKQIEAAFTLRAKREFILRQAAIIKFASALRGELEARVSVGEKPGLLLSTFERGGTRTSKTGRVLAVPLTGGARPTLKADIPTQLYLRRLAIRRGRGKRGSRALRGLLGTFIVPGVGVLQRLGGVAKLLYAYKPSVPIPRKLQFIKTATTVARRWFAQELAIQVREALEFARRRK